jgi:hypothetical protein
MTDGLNLTGFNEVKPAGTNEINAHYSDNTGSAFAATDKSTQDSAGVNQGGK